MMDKEQSLPDLVAEIEKAETILENRRKDASIARNQETNALNNLNTLQKTLDKKIEALHKDAPRDTEWKRHAKESFG